VRHQLTYLIKGIMSLLFTLSNLGNTTPVNPQVQITPPLRPTGIMKDMPHTHPPYSGGEIQPLGGKSVFLYTYLSEILAQDRGL